MLQANTHSDSFVRMLNSISLKSHMQSLAPQGPRLLPVLGLNRVTVALAPALTEFHIDNLIEKYSFYAVF